MKNDAKIRLERPSPSTRPEARRPPGGFCIGGHGTLDGSLRFSRYRSTPNGLLRTCLWHGP